LASLDELDDAEIEQLWIDEAIRRDQEIDKGASKKISDRRRTRSRKGST
jgi:hypothetical protein